MKLIPNFYSLHRSIVLPLMVASALFTAVSVQAAAMKGDGVTQSTDITGKIISALFSFDMNVINLSGDLSQHNYSNRFLNNSGGNITNGINEVSSQYANIECLNVSADGQHAWFSGTIYFQTPDPRVNAATNLQRLLDVATYNPANGSGAYLVAGRIDAVVNGVQTRSLIFSSSNLPEVDLADAGTINSVSMPFYDASGASLCNEGDQFLGGLADFLQLNTINGHRGCVTGVEPKGGQKLCDIQWLQPDDSTKVGVPQPNVPGTFANPPAASLYSLAAVKRTFSAGRISISQ